MQDKKKFIMNALAHTVKDLRGKKSQFILSSENDISISIISNIERGLKDPQLTTIFKISEAFGISPVEFIKLICDKLPKDFTMIEK